MVNYGCSDVNDLGQVIAQWGNCVIGAICTADVNGDCTVNINDLLAVTSAWGCSPCGSGFDGPSGSPPSLEYVIGVVLDSSASPATQADIIEQLLANYP